MVLGTVAFGGIGLVLAGTLKPLVNLAVVNGLFVVLLLLGGMLIPLGKLPTWLADVVQGAPGLGAVRRPPRHARARDPGVGPGLGGAGRLGGGRPGGGRSHLPLGVSGREWTTVRGAGTAEGSGPAARTASGRQAAGAGQPVQPLGAARDGVTAPRSRGRAPGPSASMKKVLRLAVESVECRRDPRRSGRTPTG